MLGRLSLLCSAGSYPFLHGGRHHGCLESYTKRESMAPETKHEPNLCELGVSGGAGGGSESGCHSYLLVVPFWFIDGVPRGGMRDAASLRALRTRCPRQTCLPLEDS